MGKSVSKKGFTIVEIVIVLAVIAVLAAVLIPTFSGVTRSADETSALADSKISYEEYLADRLPEDIDDELFVQVKKGYVHYLDGSALKTGDSYVTKIDEFDQWIDPRGNYHPAFYITIDKLEKLFIDDCNAFFSTHGNRSVTDVLDYTNSTINDVARETNWEKPWADITFYNRWSWIIEFSHDLAQKQNVSNAYENLEKFLSEKGQDSEAVGYGYVLQNITVFFRKLSSAKWLSDYEPTYGKLPNRFRIPDFTEVTFGDYAPYIPYELFDDDRVVARDQLYNQLISELVIDVQSIKGSNYDLDNLKGQATGYNVFVGLEGTVTLLSNKLDNWKWILEVFKEVRRNSGLDVSQYDTAISTGKVTGDVASINLEFLGLILQAEKTYVVSANLTYRSSDYSNEENMLKVLGAYYDSKNFILL